MTPARQTAPPDLPRQPRSDPHQSASPDTAETVERDCVTRYLCAAAHLDARFADAAISEYLVERTRALPPSPGIDVAAVLREAVAARSRRRLRDGILLALVALFVIFCFPLAIFWLVVGAGVAWIGARFGPRLRLAAAILGALLGLVALLLSGIGLSFVLLALGLPSDLVTASILPVLLGLLVFVVLVVDEQTVTEITRKHFREGNFVADASALPAGWVRNFRTLGHATYRDQLNRVAAAEARARARDGHADVIVHRHRVPFIGAGDVLRDEVLALPLIPDEDATEPPVPFTPRDLHEHVSGRSCALRDSASLSPGRRLSSLSVIEQVFLPAEQLLRDIGTSLRPRVLPDLYRPPVTHLPLEEARRLADEPQESARYYRCYRVESWDRDLATSSYFTVGTDLRTLYLEWTHCVLFPIRPAYRAIDRHPETGPTRRAFEAAVTLPVTLPLRVVDLFRNFSPSRSLAVTWYPDRYGASRSLRELAAGQGADSFFQDADAIRYLQIVEQAMFKAVSTFLEHRHYSIEDVLGAAKAKVANSITIENGTFVNSAVGMGRVQQTTAAPSSRPRRKEQK